MSKESRRRSRRDRHLRREEPSRPSVESPASPAQPGEAPLPQDIDIAHEMIRALLKQLRQSQRNEEQLRQSIDDLVRRLYGSKTEKVDTSQLLLFAADELARFDAAASPEPAAEAAPAPGGAKKKGSGRKELPKNLPRRRVVHDLPEAQRICPCCRVVMQPIREEVSEQLEYEPASLAVIESVRIVYGCATKCDEMLAVAPKPAQPIEKGIPGPGLLAYIVGSKYGEHLPLYRIEDILGRQGVQIGRSTLCGWMGAASDLVEPLWRYLKAQVLKSFCVATDETSVLVLDRANKRNFKARIWVFCGDRDHPWLIYHYTPTRERDGPETFLGEYEGRLQADAYTGYDGIYAPGRIVEIGCWMHGRRYWFKASLVNPAIPMLAMIPRALQGRGPVQAPLAGGPLCLPAGTGRARPQPHGGVDRGDRTVDRAEEPGIRRAPLHAQPVDALRRYTEDGRLEIDNGRSERALKLVAIGRRNWLFAGSPEGGRRAANLFSMTGSCMLHGIDPETYLRDVFSALPSLPESQLPDWTPLAWATRQPARA